MRLCQCAVGKRQVAINFPRTIDVPLAVFNDFGELAGAVVRINFGSIEALFRGWNAKRFRQRVQADMLSTPFAPLLHGVVDRRVPKAGEGNVYDTMQEWSKWGRE